MELEPKEQQLLAFALFTTGMRIGPDVFATIESIVEKIGISDRLVLIAGDWINYSNTVKAADVQGVDFLQKFKK